MSGATRQSATLPGEAIALWVGIGAAVIGGGGLWATVHLGAAVDGLPTPANNPTQLLGDLVKDRSPWPPSATWIGIALLALLLAVTATAGWSATRHRGKARRERRQRGLRHHADASRPA